jgi:O-antigen/teichoic acid export membrane protein
MIHSIGKENFGLYTLAMSVISLFVFDFGLSTAVIRFLSKYLAEGRQDKANNCLGIVYKLYFVIDALLLLCLIGVYFFIPQIYDSLTAEELDKFKIVYIIASCFSVISFPFIPVNGVLSANEKFIQLKICELINKLLIVGLMSMCLLLGYGLYALVSVNAIAGVIMIVLKLCVIRKYTSTRVNFSYSNNSERRELLSYSGWTTLISLSQRLIMNIAPSILGCFSGSASIAVFSIALTIEGYVFVFTGAINGMLMPKVSRIYANEGGNVLPLMIKVGRIQLMVILTFTLIFYSIGADFIRLWVGESFSLSFYCAIFLTLPCIFHIPQEVASTAVFSENKVKKLAFVCMAMAATNLAFAFGLTPLLGPIGVSVSVCIAYIVRTIGHNIIYYRDLHIDIANFFKQVYLPMIIPTIIILAVGLLLNHLFISTSWIYFGLKAIILVAVAIRSYWAIYMNSFEKQLLSSMVIKMPGVRK